MLFKLSPGIILVIFLLLTGFPELCIGYSDSTPPSIPIVSDDGKYTASSKSLHVRLSSNDPESRVVKYKYCIGTAPNLGNIVDWATLKLPIKKLSLNTEIIRKGLNLKKGQIYYFTVIAINSAGLNSRPGISDGIVVDNKPPAGRVIINNKQTYANSREVVLTINAADDLSGMGEGAQMRFSNNRIIWSSPESYSTTKKWVLSSGDGKKSVYVRVKDVAGNWSRVFADSIILDTIPPRQPILYPVTTPTTVSVQTISGTKGRNASVWLNDKQIIPLSPSIKWSHKVGLSIGSNPILIFCRDKAGNSSLPVHSDIVYDFTAPSKPQVFDDGDYTNSKVEIHANWQAQDSETGISEYSYAIGTTQGENGTDIRDWTSTGLNTDVAAADLRLDVEQNYYFNVKARNVINLWSEVGSSDGIVVLNQSPAIVSLAPENHSKFLEGDIIEIAVQAEDPNNDDLEYRYLVNGEIMQDWSSRTNYLWQTQAGDARLKTIRVEVRDQYGAVVSNQVNVFLFRKPLQPE